MDENIHILPPDELPSDQKEISGSERTKKFLKKLEIQHKVLKKMIGPDPTGFPAASGEDDPD